MKNDYEIKNLPRGWVVKTLGEVCEIARGGSPRPINKFITEDEDGINWIKISDATRSKKYIYRTKEKIIREGISSSRVVNDGDFILSNSMSFGRPYIMRTTGCVHDGWLTLSRYQKNLDIEFFYYLLSSPVVVYQFEALAQGSTVRNLNKERVSGVKIKIPPLQTQQKIVEKLDALFVEIDRAQAAIEANILNVDALLQSYLKEVFEKGGEGWETKKLGEVCELINRGISPIYSETEGVRILNQKCVRNHVVNYAMARRHDNTSKVVKHERMIKIGDVLVNSTGTGTLGRVALVESELHEPTTVDTHITIVRPCADKFDLKFFGLMLISIEEKIKQAGEGSVGQIELARSTLINKFFVSFPNSKAKQRKISIKLDALFVEIDKAQIANKKKKLELAALKQSILQQAFNGELIQE